MTALTPGDRLDHVAYAVRDVDAALPWWTEVLGLPLVADEVAEEPGSRLAYLDAGGGVFVQLVQPVRLNAVSEFLDAHGEGLHHVAFRVASIEATTARLSDPAPVFAGGRGCRACFLTTAPAGLRVELVQPPGVRREGA
ncbi:VOC family protein [Streptomyces sp. CRN 30]|uniref:VOC family protein n=1 Tax=Streptomyces sp. CRN 30 TaxID=3075613 RepID=UPI002A8033EB|nr:VOC family protein [Streptomyces sp. CRN 30]